MAHEQPAFARPLLRLLSHPLLLPRILELLPDQAAARGVIAVLSNTASPTVLQAGAKINVIPATAELHIDGRLLPGQDNESFWREVREIVGPDIELEVIKSLPPVVTEPVESPLLDVIRRRIEEREPDAMVVPYMIPGLTDAKFFTRLGMRWYGFSPVKIDAGSGIRFADMFHGHSERVPIAGLRWGARLLYDVVTDFCARA